MRRFEFVGDGSEKFWEVAREGSEVTVRFGRIGTNGQTQVKDLCTEAAATAHLDKLVAETVKKGYVEGAGVAAPVQAAASAPRVPRNAKPVAASSAAAVAEKPARPDETTFALPAAWARQAEPFRGRRPSSIKVDFAAVGAKAEELRKRADPAIRRILEHPSSEVALVKRAELHTGTAGGLLRRAKKQDDQVGAAVLTLAWCATLQWNEREKTGPLIADELVRRHGVVFAAEVGSHMAAITVTSKHGRAVVHGGQFEQWIKAAQSGEINAYAIEPVVSRLRAHVAAADDATYDEVVRRLGGLRQGPAGTRIVASYLAPTEQGWVDQDVAALATLQSQGFQQWPMLLASATTRAQVNAVLAVSHPWAIARRPELLYSITANVGAEAAGPLITLFDRDLDAATKKRLLNMVSVLPTDEAFEALLDRIDQKYVQPVVIEAMARFPERALRLLSAKSAGSDAKARTCRELLRGHLISNPGLAEDLAGELDGASAKALDAVGRATAAVPTSDAAAIPPILASPPWSARKKAEKPVVVAGLAPPAGLTLAWKPGEQAEWAQTPVHAYFARQFGGDWKAAVLDVVDPATRNHWGALNVLAAAPPDVVRPYLARFTPTHTYDALPALRRLLGGVGDDAMVFVYRVVMTRPNTLAPALLPFEGAEAAARMAEWLVRAKTLRPLTRTWLERHPDAAARDLVPSALSKPGKERTAAETALRVLDQAGNRTTIRKAAEKYGPDALAAIDAALDADPLDRLPAKVPVLPAWLDPAHLPQVLLPGRETALPADAVANICTMLAMSKPGDTYAGVEIVKDAVDPASLAEMTWGLLERWQGAGYPSKEAWVLEALALVGDDETVRRLTPLIRVWPGEGAHARAVAALDVLSAIGSDVALMHLHGIAEKAKFKGLKTKARDKMEEVADALGLTAEQLADRLVPDFGLDSDGSMVLDYGPRRFKVGFDEQLKPVIADEDGSRRSVLPKPAAKDDQALASSAYATFSGLKKDVKTISADQLRRFERAMVLGRRWTAAEQRTLFNDHPLLWHLTRRLVWATFDPAGVPTGSFRVAEDRTLASVADDEIELSDDTTVGIAHPLHLDDELTSWSDVFADYEILQPFPQLGRDVWQLTPEEKKARVINRLAHATIETGRILGLSHRGWERGTVMDGGVSGVVQKPVAGGKVLVIDLDPGLIAGAAMEWKEQKITGVWISDGPVDWGNAQGNHPFSTLDDVTASELIRDLEHLRG